MNKNIQHCLTMRNGVIKASDARLAGISNKVLQYLVETGELERLSRGIYMDANMMEDVYFVTQCRCRRGIYSYETALFLHNLSDRTPEHIMLTIPSGYNTRILKDKERYQFFYCKQELYELGVMTVKSPFGHAIKVYNKERTICDCIKKKNKLDANLVLEAVKQYMHTKGNDYARLLKYAEELKVRDTVKQYMEVFS